MRPVSNLYGKGLRGKATRLHSLVVRARGRCERCGSTQSLQAAHIIPRRYAATRVDPVNAWCLCAACHLRTTEWASEHMALVEQTIGLAAYEELRLRAEAGVKANDPYWQTWIDALTVMLEDVA
jgi:5-methylcytosine-specific restriction endonuclease McrA